MDIQKDKNLSFGPDKKTPKRQGRESRKDKIQLIVKQLV